MTAADAPLTDAERALIDDALDHCPDALVTNGHADEFRAKLIPAVESILSARETALRERLAQAWDGGYEAGSGDEAHYARGLSTDPGADEVPHINPYRGQA